MSKTVNFKIQSLESQGMGVSKSNDQIIFIPKTLPQEEGEAIITASKKTVSFAKLDKLTKESPLRSKSPCPHFHDCGGCDYLHTDYSSEIMFKQNAIKEIFNRQHKIDISATLTTVSADERFGYRNRIQLHYNKKSKRLGFKSQSTKDILEVPNCLLPKPEVKEKLTELYHNKTWQKLVSKQRPQGHIEIYDKNGTLSVNINKRYAHEGFTQVNKEMNNKLLNIINKKIESITYKHQFILDLFGGSGNISREATVPTLVVDSTPEKYIRLQNKYQTYKEVNLYEPEALTELKIFSPKEVDLLIVDPPRSGFKEIDQISQAFQPKEIIYVSCNPQTLARDIKQIESSYEIEQVFLVDFFPGTKHFESMAFLRRK